MNRPRMRALGPGIALALVAMAQPWLEQRMATHMVVELPLLFAIGWWAAAIAGKPAAWLRAVNVAGLPGLAAATAITGFWMLPLALDAAVLSPVAGWLKVAGMVAAGGLANVSLREARAAVQAFFVLGWVWMTGMAGALYQQAPERLCSTYLQGDQAWAGLGLVVLAAGVTGAWMWVAFRKQEAPDDGGFS